MPMILIEGGRKKGSFNLHATGLQEAPLVISLISAVTHSRAPQFVISGILCTSKKTGKKRKITAKTTRGSPVANDGSKAQF